MRADGTMGIVMNNTTSLKRNNDFRRIYSRGKSFAGGYTVVYMSKNRLDSNRVGLTVSKSIGKAVTRNRLKRLMRESLRQLEDKLPKGYDIIIVSRSRAVGKSQMQIMKDMEYVMRKLGLIEN